MTPLPTHPDRIPVDLDRINQTLRTAYWEFILREPLEPPPRLLPFLVDRLPHIPADSWGERFAFGGIYVNGIESLGDQDLPCPARVEYYEPKFPISSAQQLFPAFREEFILHDDGDIVAVYKPPHLSSMPAKEQRHYSVKASLERILNRVVHMPSRLDVSAQGLLVVSASPRAHAGLQRAFESRAVHKTYKLATLSPCDTTPFTVNLNIARHPCHAVLRTTSLTEGQRAQTDFTFTHTHRDGDSVVNVLTAHPITGRTHQIRVHAAASGLPIRGDNFYGGAPAPHLHLVSESISFVHPVTQQEFQLSLPEHLTPTWCRR